MLKTIRKYTPPLIKSRLPHSWKATLRQQGNAILQNQPSVAHLQHLMRQYQTSALTHTSPTDFRQRIDQFLSLEDAPMEGYTARQHQRDLSIKFHWGHNHNFGDFQLDGKMGNRHIYLLATFIDMFNTLPKTLTGKRVLDIGCWTGGTSLVLAAMGAEVVAIEEVKKYADCVNFLKEAFQIDTLTVQNKSLFDCNQPEFFDAFDYVLFSGVIYHVTDPILALRITFNCLKDGGFCLLETAAIAGKQPLFAYEGAKVLHGQEHLNRSGWNWFVPTASALKHMMADVGFTHLQVSDLINERVLAVGQRTTHRDMLRAGLSVRTIR